MAGTADRAGPRSIGAGRPAAAPGPRTFTIGVMTYRRPLVLARTLPSVLAHVRAASNRFDMTGDVLVVDNDPAGSAAATVEALSDPLVRYVHEPVPGISAARNKALACAATDLLIFLDDDEEPRAGWLDNLLSTHQLTGAGVVCGKVHAEFAGPLDPWIAAGEFFRRATRPTGTVIHTAPAGNLLLDLRRVLPTGVRFEQRFGLSGGEDNLFSRRLDQSGVAMVWCEESVATDIVPVERMTRRWVLERAFSHGNGQGLVDLELAGEQVRTRLGVRLGLVGRGTSRIAIGGLRVLYGLVRRNLRHQARGARAVWRGAGMITSALGLAFHEYARDGRRLRRVRSAGRADS